MKKTNFFKLMLVGAAALAIGFTSCTKGPSQGDFDDLCEQVSAIDTRLTDLESKFNAMTYVKSVTLKDGNVIVVTPGPTGNAVDLKVEIEGGETPPPPVAGLSIGENGNWYIDNEDTGFAANAMMPRIVTVEGVRYWEYPVFEDGEVVYKRGEVAPAVAYAVQGTGGWSLWLPTQDNMNTLTEIKLPGASSGLGKIDILGWIEGYDPKDNFSTRQTSDETGVGQSNTANNKILWNGIEQTFVVYYNWIEQFEGEANGASFSGAPSVNTGLPYWIQGYQPLAANTTPFFPTSTYLYWDPVEITEGEDPAGVAGSNPWDYTFGAQGRVYTKWDGGQYQVKAKNVLNILDSQDKGFIVQVHPLTVPFADFNNLELQNSKGETLPVAFQKPVLISGLLTRAAAQSALYFVEGSNFPKGEFSSRVEYASKFTPNALYTLVSEDGIRSEYTEFTIIPTYLASMESQVIEVAEEQIKAPTATAPMSFHVEKDQWSSLGFDPTHMVEPEFGTSWPLATTRGVIEHDDEITPSYDGRTPTGAVYNDFEYFNPIWPEGNGFWHGTTVATATPMAQDEYLVTNAVVDWYMEVGSNDSEETYVTNVFGIQFNDEKTEFRATNIPDGLTEAQFHMRVFKLGIDGKIYLQVIKINVTREAIETPIPVNPYLVQDEFPVIIGNNATDYLSSPISVDLTAMFTDLRAVPDVSTTNGRENMANRWMDQEWGARTWAVRSVVNVTEDEDQTERFFGTNATSASLAEFPDDNTTASVNIFDLEEQPEEGKSAIRWYGSNNAVVDVNNTIVTLSELFDARKLEIYPNYAYNPGSGDVRTFDLGDDYEITIDFFDRDGKRLNAIIVEFTPEKPILELLFKKDDNRWNADQTILKAYYDVPLRPWNELKFYGTDINENDDWRATSGAGVHIGTTKVGRVAYNDMINLGATPAEADTFSKNSTYYNVFNPGGITDMTHTSWRPLDGGYVKVGQRGAADDQNPKQWLEYTQVRLKDPDGDFEGGEYQDYIGTPGSAAAGGGTAAVNGANGVQNVGFNSGTMVQLYNQTNQNGEYSSYMNHATTPETANYTGIPFSDTNNAYGDVIPMMWEIGPYIGFYDYTDEEMAQNDFSIQIMSALAEGSIEPTGTPMENMGAMYSRLTREHIIMKDYAGNVRNIFKEWVPRDATNWHIGYAYTYIAKVEFTRPAEVTDYDIYDADYQPANNRTAAIDPSGDGTNAANRPDDAYLPLLTKNTFVAGPTKIHVKVYDRFGRTLEQDVTFNIVDENR